ncbi:hypothetical protein Q8A67_008667 [Cirrhinus molitorella]|uniref:Fibronectin type III domain-containing protein 7 n=1 Tax=Cirrhinus molitorella TaxID=172907 RepID=A0AA88PTK8_9TELE|nr:hypothetical protein Q8A67_008667 [Cirrhinus molitorella]
MSSAQRHPFALVLDALIGSHRAVPAASQITYSKAISSTSIKFEWSSAQGADKYILVVNGTFHPESHNLTFTTLSGQIDNLQRATSYNCYVYSANAAGLGAKSLVKTIRTLVQPPDTVFVSALTQSTARVTWNTVTGVLLYQLSVTANNNPGLAPLIKNVTSNAVNISNLEPCTTYTIGVASINMFLEPGESTNYTYTTPTISAVSSISVEYNCLTSTALVSWDASFGATSYRASITDGQGRSLNCTSTDTACEISTLTCGERYHVWITAIANCESTSDGSYFFETAPCPPKSPKVYRECSTNVILFSWDPTNNTVFYFAMAMDSDGAVMECLTVDTSCYFTDTVCGQIYTFIVSSIYSGGLDCNSGYTEGVVVKTSPCLPQNIYTIANCSSISSAVITWDPVAGAESYVVEAHGNSKDFYNCTSANTSCMLTDLDCGESLSVWIVAKNSDCTTDPVLGEVAETVPCIPQNVSAVKTCSSNSSTITWNSANGAIFYYGLATHLDGTVHTCTAMVAECTFIGLRCGETYDVHVMSTNQQCNSSESEHITLQTAPCAPLSVGVSRDCTANHAIVSWQALQAGSLYTAVLQDLHGPSVNCSTSSNNCTFGHLPCGINYNVTVTSNDGQCMSLPSTPIQIQSSPCDPQNITALLQCNTNTANVTWAASAGANGYTAMATDGQQQHLASCHSMGTSCQLTSLPCGMRLNVTVQADGATCNSSSQPKAVVETAPCIPTNVAAALNCTSKIASITWQSALGATWYMVKADGNQGYKTSCNNTVTQCDIPNLQCGQTYSITVIGMNGGCMGPASQPVTLVSAPCHNTGIQANLDCHTNSALISWTPGNGSLSFNATLQSFQDPQKYSCFTNGSSCSISSLPCGQHYNISVTGYGQTCSTCTKTLVTVDTAPCVPTQVNVSLSCGSDTASVSWAASSGLVSYYTVTAVDDNGHTLSCNSSSTSCNINGLACGQAYNVSVTAISVDCTGQRSEVRRISATPCAPQSVVSQLVNCQTGDVQISWQSSNGAQLYYAQVKTINKTLVCNSTSTSCIIPALGCGQTYNITVVGEANGCRSNCSLPSHVTTAPCPPTSIAGVLDCSSNTVLVSWSSLANSGVQYTARAIGPLGPSSGVECNTTNLNCTLAHLQCGSQYNISVTATQNNCTSKSSTEYSFITAPCVPVLNDVALNCSSMSAMVNWSSSASSLDAFSVSAVSAQGEHLGCGVFNNRFCVVEGLQCGQTYTFSVNSTQGQCISAASNTLQRETAPCPPLNIQSIMNCGSNTASVSWSGGSGALSFIMTMECSNGQTYSCRTNATGCDITNMACGQTCTVKVVAEGRLCNSSVGTGSPVITAPCHNTGIQASLDCHTNSALISWTPGNGSLSFNATLQSFQDPQKYSCFTNGSSCSISSLPCGQHYNISVTGYGQTCSTCTKTLVTVDTAPCVPTQVNVSLSCGSDTASVSWAASSGLVSYYTVTAVDDNGHMLTCNSSSTSCNINSLACGQAYNVSVTAISVDCTGQRSEVRRINTTPCAPQSVVSQLLNCQTGDVQISWQSSNGAQLYYAQVKTINKTLVCNSTSTSCIIPALGCGQTYNITVVGEANGCRSNCSLPSHVTTAPCPPTSIAGVLDCSSNTVLVSWSSLAISGVQYTARAIGPLGPSSGVECNTTNLNCTLAHLQCGSQYNVSVTATQNNCTSKSSTEYSFITAPCVPVLNDVALNCSSMSAMVNWSSSASSLDAFSVSAVSAQGEHLGCGVFNNRFCVVEGLQCGQTYTFSVNSTQSQCISAASNTLQRETAPCPPLNIQSIMNCGSNTVSGSWSGGSGALSFMMIMECSNGQTYTCRTNATGCDITNMACGQTCTVKVVAEGRLCNSSVGTGSPVVTGPCVPQNVSASVSCSSNIATVTWGSSQGAEAYAVTASSANGLSVNCSSISTSCDLQPLTCGESYTITVKAKGSNCSSGNSAPVQVKAVPCTPSNVLPTVDCVTNALVVSWTPSAGGQFYTATLQDSNGLSSTCQSTGSQCNVTGLRCGQLYHVNVTASDSLCSSPPSATVSTNSIPCAVSSIKAVLDCQLDTATVSWQYGAGAQGYAVSALAPVNNRASCTSNSSFTHCELSSLQCGNEYTVNVQSLGQTCNASAQMTGSLITGPCVPQHLTVHYSPSTALLSWDVTRGATNFTAVAVTPEGLTVTCETSNTSCTFPNLGCGQIYNVSVTAHNSLCSDTVTSDPIETEPCPPQHVQASLNCATLSAMVSWEPSQLAVGYAAFLEGRNGHSTSCRTNHTYCSLPGLTCGTVYYVKVRAIGEVFNSSDSIGVNMTSAPCLSTSVSAIVDCPTDSVLVSWSAIAGAENYSVTALGSGGQTVSCTTSQNQCNISSLQCGQQFNVTFTSTNHQCQMSTTMSNVTFQSRPCVPLHPVVDKLCGNKMSVMSWDVSERVDYYVAQAVSAAGQYQLCNSTSSVCSFPTLGCGATYSFTVTAHRGVCQSDASAPTYLTTDPCKPENVTAHVSCDSETVALDWSKAKGASFYIVMATGSLGYIVDFNTTSTNLSVSLLCGQGYNISVQAQNEYCESPPSTPAVFRLAPCTPLHLVTYIECENQLGSVSWGPSDGANMYTATAVGADGHTHLCVTNGTSCTWENLHCGEIYNVTVTANDSRCASARSNSTIIHMAPCVPQALTPVLDCGTGVGQLSWASSAGAKTYEVVAVSGDGNITTFSTNITTGFLSEMLCGQQYQITVRAINSQCRSALSSSAYLSSAPCAPQNVVSELDCLFNFITIRWNTSHGAASYLVVAKGPEGPVTACNTTAQECTLQTLHCSSSYNVSVIAVNQQCKTLGSSILQINTVPCVPSHVQGSVNCTTGHVSVSWDPSMGAISYAAVAQTSGGYASVCNSTGTACVFSDLLCGMNYSLAVSATDGTCNTAQSQPLVLSTVSCKPQNATAQLNCDTNSAVVSWELSDNVTRHTVQAIGSDGHRINCSSFDHSCALSGLHCGKSYNITVTASDGVCDNSNTHLILQSAPCAPNNIQTSLHCDVSSGGVVSVSWAQATGAESYTAVAVSNDGHTYSCNTTADSCDLQQLQCGQIYNVSVYSLAQGCGGVKSTTSQEQTAPCPPQNVSAIVQCGLGSVLVSWNPAVDASEFRVELESQSTGAISSFYSRNTQWSFAPLPCGERFNLSVVALGGSCQSQPSSDLSIAAAPCTPQGVNGTVDCITNSAWVSWNADNGIESYTVLAVGDDGQNSTCSSSNSTCNVPDLGCGKSYTFYITASNAACVSPPSSSFQLETAPCALSSIVVVTECHSSIIMVKWQRAGSGKSLYIATAEDQDYSRISCNSSASSCNLTNVHCDKEYTVIVAASANQCSSLRSPPYKIRTAPCRPSSVQANVDCQSKDVFVSWNPSYVAQSYLLTAVGRNGDLKTCDTSDNNCTLTNLNCSNTYDVSVVASNENCTSLPSANITFQTVPCEPANLTVTVQCGNSSSASLSWVGSTGAVAYMGLAQSESGTTVHCETTQTSCTLEGLVCGTVYNFTVQAKDGTCNNSLSKSQTKGAAPCPPAGFKVVPRTLMNDTQILRASWSTVNCPNSEYLLALMGSIQGNSQALFDVESYWTSRTFFEVPLPCSSSYSATISARNSAATSDKSAPVTGTTVPCAPLNVTFSASSAVVAWNEALFATNYTVYGVTSSSRTKLCVTSQHICSVANFSSGHIVVTASNTAGESQDSVPVLVTAGRRRRR